MNFDYNLEKIEFSINALLAKLTIGLIKKPKCKTIFDLTFSAKDTKAILEFLTPYFDRAYFDKGELKGGWGKDNPVAEWFMTDYSHAEETLRGDSFKDSPSITSLVYDSLLNFGIVTEDVAFQDIPLETIIRQGKDLYSRKFRRGHIGKQLKDSQTGMLKGSPTQAISSRHDAICFAVMWRIGFKNNELFKLARNVHECILDDINREPEYARAWTLAAGLCTAYILKYGKNDSLKEIRESLNVSIYGKNYTDNFINTLENELYSLWEKSSYFMGFSFLKNPHANIWHTLEVLKVAFAVSRSSIGPLKVLPLRTLKHILTNYSVETKDGIGICHYHRGIVKYIQPDSALTLLFMEVLKNTEVDDVKFWKNVALKMQRFVINKSKPGSDHVAPYTWILAAGFNVLFGDGPWGLSSEEYPLTYSVSVKGK